MAKQAHFYNNNFINHTSVYKNYKIMIFMTSTLDFFAKYDQKARFLTISF